MIEQREKYNFNLAHKGLDYGSDYNHIIDKINAFLLVIAPILQHYKGFYRNAAFSIIFFVVAISFFRFCTNFIERKFDPICIKAMFPLLLFQIYRMFDHSVSLSKFAYALFMVVILVEIACGAININLIVKYATIIGSLAAVGLVIQYISFYIFDTHIIMVPIKALLPESDAWLMSAKTGLYGLRGIKNGFYRPSAFFLEPSHLFLYCFPMLCMNLLLPHINRRRKQAAILLTLGMFLSTSGMGVAVAIFIWIVYLLFYKTEFAFNDEKISDLLKRVFNKKTILILIVLIIILIILYFQVPVIQNTINRVFFPIQGKKSSAISGRTRQAQKLVRRMSAKSFIFGETERVGYFTFNLPGFYATLYKYGIIGLFLSYWFYGQGLFRLKTAFFWFSFIIVVISFFTAHTHGTFYMLYYIALLMEGYHQRKSSPTKSLLHKL